MLKFNIEQSIKKYAVVNTEKSLKGYIFLVFLVGYLV